MHNNKQNISLNHCQKESICASVSWYKGKLNENNNKKTLNKVIHMKPKNSKLKEEKKKSIIQISSKIID